MTPEIKVTQFQQLESIEAKVFKLSQLSYYVCCCYGILLHGSSYDTSRRQSDFILFDHKTRFKSLQ